MKTGVILGYQKNIESKFAWCMERHLPTCQLSVPRDEHTAEYIREIKAACKSTGMEITAVMGGWSGPSEWNFRYGPNTLGIVPVAYRNMRMQELIRCAEIAEELEVHDVCTHMGFIPENPSDPMYPDFISAAKYLAWNFDRHGVSLNFETGQETPVTLLRTFTDMGVSNVGLNFDPANLLMYGKANPIDALDVIGQYVRGVHAKDGMYPTNGYELGKEMPLGQGRVNFPAFIQKLKEVGYDGALTIEREISGEQQQKDVLMANEMLLKLI